jgi:hypothetical protein
LRTLNGGFQFESYRLEATDGFSPRNEVQHLKWHSFDDTTTSPVWTMETSDRTMGVLVSRYDWPSLGQRPKRTTPTFEWKWDRTEDLHYVNTWRGVVLPYWALGVAATLLPIARALLAIFRLERRRRLNRVGLCPRCGYDLRGTPDGCPECGTPAAGGPRQVASDGYTAVWEVPEGKRP